MAAEGVALMIWNWICSEATLTQRPVHCNVKFTFLFQCQDEGSVLGFIEEPLRSFASGRWDDAFLMINLSEHCLTVYAQKDPNKVRMVLQPG